MNKPPEVSFIDNMTLDGVKEKLISAYKEKYEEITGRSIALAKADPERLKLEAAGVILYQMMMYIQRAGEQNLLFSSYGPYLDNLGALKGVSRLKAQKSETELKFILSAEQEQAVKIPKGTMATDGNGTYFQTEEKAEIAPGDLSVTVKAECTEAGSAGNGLAPGTIKYPVNMIPFVVRAENITETQGGSDVEDDESFAERIYLAPSSYSTAGARDAYIYHTKSFNQAISGVSVTSPEPCEVEIRVILDGGVLPGETFLAGLKDHLNDDKIRPLTDNLTVKAPETVKYNLDVKYYISKSDSAQAENIQQKVNEAIEDYIVWQCSEIGRDINPSELTAAVMRAGAKRVEITSPSFTEVISTSVALLNSKSVEYGGLEDD